MSWLPPPFSEQWVRNCHPLRAHLISKFLAILIFLFGKAEIKEVTTYLEGGWLGGPFLQEIIPLCGSILQVRTCYILSLAENPSSSLVKVRVIKHKLS